MANGITYLYNPTFELALGRGNELRVNNPMYRNNIKIFKGVSNQIDFVVRDLDRKPVKLTHLKLMIVIKDQITDQEVLRRFVQIIDDRQGRYQARLEVGDIEDWEPGYYTFCIISIDCENRENLLLTDTSQGVLGILEVDDAPLAVFRKSFRSGVDDFTPLAMNNNYLKTGRLPGIDSIDSQFSLHTIAVYLENWSGDLVIQGSLESDAQVDQDWFDIDILSFIEASEIFLHNFNGQFRWIRFIQRPAMTNIGEINQILLRF